MDELSIIPNYEDEIYDAIVKEYLGDRMIILNNQIDDSIFEYVCLSILRWNIEDKGLPVKNRKRGKILISSNGGDAIVGDQILSSITTSITPIDTIGFGKCLSMGSYILAAGAKRYCFPNTVVLYHDGESGYVTSANKGRDIQKFYDELNSREIAFMTKHTNMTAEFLDEIKDREYYMFAEDAKEKGVVDAIIGIDCTIDDVF